MFNGKNGSRSIEAALSASIDYEVSLSDMARRSERRAWFVALAAVTMALLLAAGYFLLLPLKERVPFLVMADAYTGQATVARLRGDFGTNSITANEAINKSNIAHYIIARESYDTAQRNIRDWNTVYTMSSSDVAKGYTHAVYDKRNPDSLVNMHGPTRAIRVEIAVSRCSIAPGTRPVQAREEGMQLHASRGFSRTSPVACHACWIHESRTSASTTTRISSWMKDSASITRWDFRS